MLRKAILVDADYRSRVEREVVRLVESNTLWCTIDIYTLHRSVALHDTFTGSVVSVTACLTVVRENHQPIILIPVHLTGSIRRVVRYQCWITVGIVCVMIVTNLRWSRRMVTVLILISKVITLGCVVVTTKKLPLQPLEF